VKENPDATPGIDYFILWRCPICGHQANRLTLGRAECDGKGARANSHPGPVDCVSEKVMPWDGTLADERTL
jgi:hypothetical protein